MLKNIWKMLYGTKGKLHSKPDTVVAKALKITASHNVHTKMCSLIEQRDPQSPRAIQIGIVRH